MTADTPTPDLEPCPKCGSDAGFYDENEDIVACDASCFPILRSKSGNKAELRNDWNAYARGYRASLAAPQADALTLEDIERNKEIARKQFVQLKGAGSVTCTCGHTIPARFAYKCLYCDIFRCMACSESHFGKTRAKYFEERAALTSPKAP